MFTLIRFADSIVFSLFRLCHRNSPTIDWYELLSGLKSASHTVGTPSLLLSIAGYNH
jgi:hypothetical protein